MKTFVSIVLGLILMISVESIYSQTTRSAKVPKFFITGAIEPFDQQRDDNDTIGLLGNNNARYINLLPQDTALSLNAEWRGIFDVPHAEWWDPAMTVTPDSIVYGLPSDSVLDVIILGTHKFQFSLANSRLIRFESERHVKMNDTAEYCGFINDSASGSNPLVGRNIFDDSATFPKFLLGTSRNSETSVNALQLVKGRDAAGVFGDSLWNKFFLEPTTRSPQNLWTQKLWKYGRNLIARFRIRVDSTIDTTGHNFPNLFHATIWQGDGHHLVFDTIVKVDEFIKHMNSGFDTISLRFRSDDTADILTDFKLYWPDSISMTMDYMEILTARLTDPQDYDIGNLEQGYGNTHSYSYEEMTENNEARLKEQIHKLMAYKGKLQYVMAREEFPLSNGSIYKRAAKLLRDSSDGQMELISSFHDSSSAQLPGAFYGSGLPNNFIYDVEAVERGWLNPDLYADPKLFIVGLTFAGWPTPLPKRSVLTGDDYRLWEIEHASITDHIDSTQNCLAYSPYQYMVRSQNVNIAGISSLRQAKRATMLNPSDSQRFAVFVQTGVGVGPHFETDTFGHVHHGVNYADGLRAMTAPALKLECNLSVSCGASGLFLYTLSNGIDGKGDGGLMEFDGSHSEMMHTFRDTLKDSIGGIVSIGSRNLYFGWKENYESAKTLFPMMRKYGDALLHAQYIGDWTAAELFLADTNLKKIMPFVDTSMRTLDDSMRSDVYNPIRNLSQIVHWDQPFLDMLEDTSNRTFVHISMWLDTNAAAIANHSDTLLYITNMRTDDSYDTSEVPTTIDRRTITLQMRARHLFSDVLDSFPSLDNLRIKTPFVAANDSLKIQLLAGDGILLRLVDGDTMHVAVNYPLGGGDFNNYGGVKFDKPVFGVQDPSTPSGYRIASSSHSFVGIRDVDTVRLWQDSLLYIKVDNADSTRKGKWRNQNWTQGAGGVGNVNFIFKNTLPPSPSRQRQISTDSLAHQIVIKTDLEGTGNNGKIRFKDPFLVDSATLKNVYDTLAKSSPFLPHVLNTNRGLGVDSEHYGGIFLKQNTFRDTGTPIYTANAYSMIKSGTYVSQDSMPDYTDWSFIEWGTNDTAVSDDVSPWLADMNGNRIQLKRKTDVVFGKDSAIYTARYKAHTSSFTGADDDPVDTGTCCNNQRKLFYIGKDSIGRRMWRFVYSSDGRIYTETGTMTGTNNADFVWKPEQLLSSWNDNHSHYPAMGCHPPTIEKFHYVYQDNTTDAIIIAELDTTGSVFTFGCNTGSADITSLATPVITSTDFAIGPIDLIAWTATDGIHLKAIGNFDFNTVTDVSSEMVLGLDANAQYPTIWVDTCYNCNTDTSKARFWIAWQQDTTVSGSTVTDIMAQELEVKYGSTHRTPTFGSLGSSSNVKDISRTFTPSSNLNLRPCISGERLNNANSMKVQLAYESQYTPDNAHYQGIEICNKLQSSVWMSTNFLTSFNPDDPYWKPSIELTKYQKVDTGIVLHANWYSIIHEATFGSNIIEWAYDGSTQRLTANEFLGLQDPQIAITHDKIDSEIHRVAMSHGGDEPRWLIPGYTGSFKLAANDSLWGYHALTEKDTGSALLIESGFGELAVDNGNGMSAFDLADRDDTLKIDSQHPKEYFMQSEHFTLPVGGTIQYCPWIRPSNDSLFAVRFNSLKFALDFYDTSGVFNYRVDSMTIHDSASRIHADLRTIYLSRESNQKGYLVFHRVSGTVEDTLAITQNIIARKRLSTISSYKQANKPQSALHQITLEAAPNPFKNEVNIFLGIPVSGAVTIEAFNTLGKSIGYLCKSRMFTEGKHQLVWQAGKLPAGAYILRLRYGNEVVTANVIAIE